MPIVTQILSLLPETTLCQRRFFLHLFGLWPCISGRFNLLNLSRYSPFCRRTFARHFARAFPWATFNAALMQQAVPVSHELMLAQDASFIAKSGKATPGLGRFYNGITQRVERGLELSLLAVIDLTQNTAYALHARQTINQAGAECTDKDLRHLKATKAHWPAGIKYLAVDGAYARQEFVEGATREGLSVVSRLRCDANVRYLYHGPQKKRGRRKQYEGKVVWRDLDLSRWHDEGELEPGVHLYSATLNHLSLKRNLKVALLLAPAKAKEHKAKEHKAKEHKAKEHKERRVLVFSTDLKLSGREIVRLYRARFQIEFLFRDAKSGAGLTHCQSRNTTALENHWNAAFAALNLARIATPPTTPPTTPPMTPPTPFSWASCCQKQRNLHLLEHFSSTLGLDWNCIKSHPNFHYLINYGVIAP